MKNTEDKFELLQENASSLAVLAEYQNKSGLLSDAYNYCLSETAAIRREFINRVPLVWPSRN